MAPIGSTSVGGALPDATTVDTVSENQYTQETAMLTAETITVDQIQQLETEALSAGDYRMVDTCQLALKQRRNGQWGAGDLAASRTCAEAINAARAQEG